MTDTVLISGFIYLACYRITVLAAGVICMILGFRLLLLGMPATNKGTEIEVATGDLKLKAANVAPGTCFAVFGVIIIAVTLAGDKPEINLLNSVAANQTLQHVNMRGSEPSSAAAEQENDFNNKRLGNLINDVAWQLYNEKLDNQGLLKLAELLAKESVKLYPDEKNYSDTLIKIQDQLRR